MQLTQTQTHLLDHLDAHLDLFRNVFYNGDHTNITRLPDAELENKPIKVKKQPKLPKLSQYLSLEKVFSKKGLHLVSAKIMVSLKNKKICL